MASTAYKQAYKEALAAAKSNVVMLHTLEITSELASTEVKDIDVCFVVDDTSSMSSEINSLVTVLPAVVTSLSERFRTVRVGLTRFKDEDDTTVVKNLTTDVASVQAEMAALVASGGGDGPENGFGATVQAAQSMVWSTSYSTRRNIVLITDAVSFETGDEGNSGINHTAGATEQQALDALTSRNIRFILGATSSFSNYNYGNLVADTNGVVVPRFHVDPLEDLVAALKLVLVVDPNLEPIYIIQARQPYELTLENGESKVFEPVAFRFTLPGQDDQGLQDLNITIDNVDKRIGDWVEAASAYDAPALVRYRPYLSTDLTTPQMDPPLTLTLSDIKRTSFEVSGRASVADIVNLKFLRLLYLRSRFPSLGNT